MDLKIIRFSRRRQSESVKQFSERCEWIDFPQVIFIYYGERLSKTSHTFWIKDVLP